MTASKGRSMTYEVMFLISQSAATDLKSVIEHIRNLIARAEGKIIAMRKWDERRLAFEIDKQKRGTYILLYFSVDPSKMIQFERDCNLSENIMRTLILKADHLTLEEMQAHEGQRELELEAQLKGSAPVPGAAPAAQPAAKPAAEPEPAGA
jgi:small subunit ribosomal protein S6